MINGSQRILYILESIGGTETYIPIGCLTSNSFNEDVEMLDTTTRLTGGWRTSRPNLQSFTVDFEGILKVVDDSSIISYEGLRTKKRSLTLLTFRLFTQGDNYFDKFQGYITDISESSVVDEFITFTGTIRGYGEPTQENIPFVNAGFQYNLPIRF